MAADGLTQASQAGVRLLPPWPGPGVYRLGAVIACADTAITARRDIT